MEKSVEEDAVVAVEKRTPQSEKRNPRRRLVQSTLFPHQTLRSDQAEVEEEEVDEECCGSQKRKKRKGRNNATTPRKVPNNGKAALASEIENGNSVAALSRRNPQQLKDKQHGDASPCKNQTPRKLKRPYCRKMVLNYSSDTVKDVNESSDYAPEPVFDLRLEAKLAAEENARIFTGKQTHPFFLSWKVGKKFQGTSVVTELENKHCSTMLESEGIACPIHVFEKMQDNVVSLDWSNWIFCDENSLNSISSSEYKCSSAFEGSIGPLKFDNCPAISNFAGVSFLQTEVHLNDSPSQVEDACPILPISSVDEQASQHQVKDLKVLHPRYLAHNLEQLQERFLPERITSYYCGHGNQLESSLWTIKYQPENASKVCGNNESVRFLNEWLGSWCERYSGVHKNSRGVHGNIIQDIDYSLDESGSDTESMDGTSFNSVLLITGPVGSGKSAAIYACAKEQGFEVIEVSASDWRNGALVKQKFGAGLESLGLNKWSLVGPVNSRRNHVVDFFKTQLGESSVLESDSEVAELIPETCEEDLDSAQLGSVNNVVNDSISGCQGADKTLILFEDVDTLFEEDRGFIATIQQIAETAKRPMILTSNSKDPVLPDQLNRLKVCFTSPTPEELFSLLYMVCATEKANIQPQLLEQLIRCCQGDMRKGLLFLQFWCQGKCNSKDRKLQSACGPPPFDLDLGHWALPNVFPWGFHCPLAELVEKETTMALSGVKENNSLLEIVMEDELGDKETQDALMMDIGRKKEALLNMNCSIHDGNVFSIQFDSVADVSNSSGSPVALTWRSARRRPSTVLSSCSGDEFGSDNSLVDLNILPGEPNHEALPDSSSKLLACRMAVQDNPVMPVDHMPHLDMGLLQEDLDNCSQRERKQDLYDMYKSVDVSWVPESSFVPETQISNGVELLSKMVSCGHFPSITDGPSCVMSIQSPPILDAENVDKTGLGPVKCSETALGMTYDVDAELAHGHGDEEVGDSQNEHATGVRGYQVMDECSRADFKQASISGENPRCLLQASISGKNPRSSLLPCSVEKTWKNFRSHRKDLKLHVTSELRDATEIVNLASRMTDLLSKADLMFSCCPPLVSDSLEFPVMPCVEPDEFYCYDEQRKMLFTIVEHGFCYFAKESSAIESSLGLKKGMDLDEEMLATSLVPPDTSMSSQKCARLGSDIRLARTDVSSKREVELHLYNMLQTVVPSKSYLALKGAAFHEYVSSLGQISKLEASRVSTSIDKPKQRCRTRASHHYLITGPLTLLPEDVSLLAQHSCYGEAPNGNN